jgi:hypothetical protein
VTYCSNIASEPWPQGLFSVLHLHIYMMDGGVHVRWILEMEHFVPLTSVCLTTVVCIEYHNIYNDYGYSPCLSKSNIPFCRVVLKLAYELHCTHSGNWAAFLVCPGLINLLITHAYNTIQMMMSNKSNMVLTWCHVRTNQWRANMLSCLKQKSAD